MDVSSICQRALAGNRYNSHNKGTNTPSLGTRDINVSIRIKCHMSFHKDIIIKILMSPYLIPYISTH